MGINSSPSLSQVQAEFGGSNPISLSEYYGVRFSQTAFAPGSGTISLNNFRNKSLDPNQYLSNSGSGSTNAGMTTATLLSNITEVGNLGPSGMGPYFFQIMGALQYERDYRTARNIIVI
jgi:hypothetical protein